MTQTVTDADLHRVLDVIAAISESPRSGPGLPGEVLTALTQLVSADVVAFTEFDPYERRVYVDQDCACGESTTRDEPFDDDSAFYDHYWNTMSCSYAMRTGDLRSVVNRSDFYSRSEWRATPMYRDCFADTGLDEELICSLPSSPTRARRIIFFRSGARDFDERDRLVVSLLRPHLAELASEIHDQKTNSSLTTRQVELLRLVAVGYTNEQIAEHLVLSAHTVRKHLENIFTRLGVNNRAAAIARAFPSA